MEEKKKKAPKKSGTFAENRKLWLAIFSLMCYYDDEPLWVVSKTNSKENPMTHTIAVAGKGGVGKTTVCGMMIDYLIKEKKTPLLVVDADANSNLNEVLGIEVDTTLGTVREEMAQAELRGDVIPKGMTKADYAEYRFNTALVEEDDFDMLVMGRTQGKGCYCFVNGILKSQVDKYVGNYKYTVIDNEAGMEHIARGTLPKVDTLLLVSDCSRRGIQAVARIADMVEELKLNPTQMGLIVNRAPGGILNEGVREEIDKHGLTLLGVLPQDDAVYEADCMGDPSSKIPDSSPMKQALAKLLRSVGI
jgi:CO dehydrogenase maturation factor